MTFFTKKLGAGARSAGLNSLAGRMWPAGRRLPTPALGKDISRVVERGQESQMPKNTAICRDLERACNLLYTIFMSEFVIFVTRDFNKNLKCRPKYKNIKDR